MEISHILLILAGLFSVGLAADQIGHRTRLPRVTLLLLCGIIAGDAGLGLIPDEITSWYELLSIVALTMVAFLLGGSLSRESLKSHGRAILAISISVVILTIAVVSAGLIILGMEPGLALLLGAIASATAPAATQDVIRQSGISNGFTEALKGIVAIDDLWGLLAFSVVLVLVSQLQGAADASFLTGSLREFGGSIMLGAAIGFPAAVITGRLSGGEPLEVEALALTFLTAGLAIWLELSYLISGMTVGAVIINRARHHTKAFHEIEHIQWPFMILFFILAGASLETDALLRVGGYGVAYMALRVLARLAGGWIGAWMGTAPAPERLWFGLALLPQAGVAIGMALVAAEKFSQWGDTIMAVTIGTTIVFELLGPPVTLVAIRRSQR